MCKRSRFRATTCRRSIRQCRRWFRSFSRSSDRIRLNQVQTRLRLDTSCRPCLEYAARFPPRPRRGPIIVRSQDATMATDPAVPPGDRTNRLWQVPTFLVGFTALYILSHSGDKLRPSVGDRYERSLHALRPAVDRWPPDIDRIHAALRKVPAETPPAELAPQAHYLIGSALVALAESTTSDAEASEWWARARQELEAAADRELPAQDQKKLRYRLARTWANTGADPNHTIEFLTSYLSAGDDPAEGHRLLADLYLKVAPPNEAKARDSLRNFLRHAPARADARSLNQARVRLAELHAKLNEPEEARKVLDRVGPEAPPELYAAARLMLADYHRADQDWTGAVKAWEQVRDMRGATEAQRSEALVRLGEAYAKLNRPGDAAAAVQQAGKSDGPGGRAGAFRTAELKLKDPAGLAAAVAALESAFAGSDAAGLRKLVPGADAKRVCTEAYEKAKDAGDFALALRAANVYAKVSENSDHHRLLAEAHHACARLGRGDDAKAHYRAAAEACTAVAAQEATPAGKVDWLREAAALF